MDESKVTHIENQITFTIEGKDYSLEIPDPALEICGFESEIDDGLKVTIATVDEYDEIWTKVSIPIPEFYIGHTNDFIDYIFCNAK